MKHTKGFNLMELMIAVTIIGIIAAIAYPSYTEHVQRTRRSDAHVALLNLAARMEHFYTENNTYVGANNPADVGAGNNSTEGFYQLTIGNQTATSYTLTATPVAGGPQASDTCGALTLTNTNLKGPNADCWD